MGLAAQTPASDDIQIAQSTLLRMMHLRRRETLTNSARVGAGSGRLPSVISRNPLHTNPKRQRGRIRQHSASLTLRVSVND
jgi:hypothetical protein